MKNLNKETRRNSSKSTNARRRSRRSKEAYGKSFERLEQRNMLAAVTVSTSAAVVDGSTFSIQSLIDSPGSDGEISLREAITAAESTFETDTITFDAATFDGEAADVIRLQSSLTVDSPMIIDGGNQDIVVSGDTLSNDILVDGSFISDVTASELAGTFDDSTNGVFVLTARIGGEATISGLTITGGNESSRGGGGVSVASAASPSVKIMQSTIAGNRSTSAGGGLWSTPVVQPWLISARPINGANFASPGAS